MTKNQLQTASEVLLEQNTDKNTSISSILLKNKLPNFIKEETKLFAKRNSIIKINKIDECCPSCLKAHLIKTAKLRGDIMSALAIEEMIPGEIGHQGYYLDKGELRKV